MLATTIPFTDIDCGTGGGVVRVPFTQAITQFHSRFSETPSSHDLQRLLSLSDSTGIMLLQEDPEYIVEKAFRFMQSAARSLPFSAHADREADAVIRQIRGEPTITPLTRKIEE